MTPEQEQALQAKLADIGYPAYVVQPGEDDILMLYVQECFVCGALYALSMEDSQLKALIDETVSAPSQAEVPPPPTVYMSRGG